MSEPPSKSTEVMARIKYLWDDKASKISLISQSISSISSLILMVTGIWASALAIQQGTTQGKAVGAISITFIVIVFVFVIVGLWFFIVGKTTPTPAVKKTV